MGRQIVFVTQFLSTVIRFHNCFLYMASCLLYQNADASISIIDIPRSIEEVQSVLVSCRRLLSSEPLSSPYPSVEPKSDKARERLGHLSLDDLILSKHLQFALEEVKGEYQGEWCLRRVVSDPAETRLDCRKRKRESSGYESVREEKRNHSVLNVGAEPVRLKSDSGGAVLYHNSRGEFISFKTDWDEKRGRLPPNSTLLCGDIATTRDAFIASAPQFDLIILDPPWPNRSARRKKSYGISYASFDIRELLSSIPIRDHFAKEGLVGVWITNKEAFREMLLQPGGLFDEWGIGLVEEWIWLKTTATGEPTCALDSVWRKPYEILLVGKKGMQHSEEVKRKVLIGVPDLHSRKPNLKPLFDQVIQKEGYEALEIFARNMTAGWWAWGNEALKFQMDECWADREDN